MIPENPVVGGTVLRRASIQSPNFVAGVSGWDIRQDGSAEFNNIVIRNGTVTFGASLFYSGTPALGALLGSIATTGFTDTFGNQVLPGITAYGVTQAVQLYGGQTTIYTAASQAGPWVIAGYQFGPPSSGGIGLRVNASEYWVTPSGDTTGATDTANINAASNAARASGNGGAVHLVGGTYTAAGLIARGGVALVGVGPGTPNADRITGKPVGTVINAPLGNAANNHMITTDPADTSIARPVIRGLTLNGQNGQSFSANVQPNTFNGIHFDQAVTSFLIDDLFITQMPGDAINLNSASDAQSVVSNCWMNWCQGHNIFCSTSDMFFSNIDGDLCGLSNFWIEATASQWSNVKSNNSGNLNVSNDWDGWHITGHDNLCTGCRSENDGKVATGNPNGVFISGNGNQWHGQISAAGNSCVYVQGTAVRNLVVAHIGTQSNGVQPNYVYTIDGNGVTNNTLKLKGGAGNPVAPVIAYSNLINGGVEFGQWIEAECEALSSRQIIAWSASVTIDPYRGGTVQLGTVNSNGTINAPLNGHTGSLLNILIPIDNVGGYTITFNAQFHVFTPPSTAANAVAWITFQNIGVNTWQQIAIYQH